MPQSIRQSRLPRSSPKSNAQLKPRLIRSRFADMIDRRGAELARTAKKFTEPDIVCVTASRRQAFACHRKQPSRHDDRSCPTDSTTLIPKEHQQHAIVCASTGLSSNFLFVHILYERALAKINRLCSARVNRQGCQVNTNEVSAFLDGLGIPGGC